MVTGIYEPERRVHFEPRVHYAGFVIALNIAYHPRTVESGDCQQFVRALYEPEGIIRKSCRFFAVESGNDLSGAERFGKRRSYIHKDRVAVRHPYELRVVQKDIRLCLEVFFRVNGDVRSSVNKRGTGDLFQPVELEDLVFYPVVRSYVSGAFLFILKRPLAIIKSKRQSDAGIFNSGGQ